MSKNKSKRREKKDGSAHFLTVAMNALQGIRDLKGLDPPKQTQVSGPGGGPIQLVARDMTDDELLAIIAEEQKQNAIEVDNQPSQLEYRQV